MRLKLLRQVKGSGKAGDVIEASPDRARFLLEFGLAEPAMIREQVYAPEKKAAAQKTTRKAEPAKAEKAPAKKTTRTKK